MALPSTGPLSMQQVAGELGISQTGINLNMSNVRSLAGKGSGTISMADLRGKSAAVQNSYDQASLNSIGSVYSSSATGSALARVTIKADGTWTTFASPNSGGGSRSGRWLNSILYVVSNFQISWNDPWGNAYSTNGNNTWYTMTADVPISVFDSSGEAPEANVTVSFRSISSPSDATTVLFTITAIGACFAFGTMLRTPFGDRYVENLMVDDMVSSFEEPTMLDESEEGWKEWTVEYLNNLRTDAASTVSGHRHFVAKKSIKINGVHSTLNHTYFVFDGQRYGWKIAEEITTADCFIDCDKNLIPITSIVHIDTPELFVALDVEDLDTLQVKYGDTYMLAHNVSA